jgi:hypothetical protein
MPHLELVGGLVNVVPVLVRVPLHGQLPVGLGGGINAAVRHVLMFTWIKRSAIQQAVSFKLQSGSVQALRDMHR